MDDYYRLRFKSLRTRAIYDGEVPRMPLPLRVVYGGCVLVAMLGWGAVLGAGRATSSLVLAGGAVLFPVAVTLALGFIEHQRWTRPLIVMVLALPATVVLMAGATVWSGVAALLPALAALAYLYLSPASRAYYSALSKLAVVELSASTLRDFALLPVYLAMSAAPAGGLLGYYLVVRNLGYSSGLGANDAMAVVCAGVLGAVLMGVLGYWCGAAIVSRRERAA